MRFMTKEEALAILESAGQIPRGEKEIPPEILTLGIAIEEATRRAYLFLVKIGRVDEGMIQDVINLKLQRDEAFARMFSGKAQGLDHLQ